VSAILVACGVFLKPRRTELDRKVIILAVLLVLAVQEAFAQPPESEEPTSLGLQSQPVRIVDFPTAGLLPRRAFRVEGNIYAEGGVLLNLTIGFTRFFSFGISYGGYNVIGTGDPELNPEPAVNLKVRLLEESLVAPAVAIGFDSQGYGKYFEDKVCPRDENCEPGETCYKDRECVEEDLDEDRYLVKSPGIYAVASKNWDVVGPLSFHGGISYSLENKQDNDLTLFVGVIKSFSDFLDIRAEYDFATNDNESAWQIAEDRGRLNASLLWHVSENISLGFEARDIATKKRTGIVKENATVSGESVTLEDLRTWNRGFSIVFRDFL
jgi:hypothetical protein